MGVDLGLKPIGLKKSSRFKYSTSTQHEGLASEGKASKNIEISRDDFSIIWRNLSYKLNQRSYLDFRNVNKLHERVVFEEICGEAKSREITAIMGRSGAGKSSLLQCLFRNKSKGVTGQVLVNSKSKKNLKICYIPQDDYLNEWLTVREDLLFVSRLKFTNANELMDLNVVRNDLGTYRKGPIKDVSIDHGENVNRIAAIVGLISCLDVSIKKISGGERKRLSIARELMSKPDILVLDEPTTGLDSLTCHKTITVLRKLVKHSPNSMAVVVTIHQPERAVFNLFDKAYLLSGSRGIVYDDNPNSAIKVMEHVANIHPPSLNYNPASFLIELASDRLHNKATNLLIHHQKLKFDNNFPESKIIDILGYKGLKAIQTSGYEPTVVDRGIEADIELNLKISSSGQSKIDLQRDLLASSDPNAYYVSDQLIECLNSHSIGLTEDIRHISILTHRAWLTIIRNPSLIKTRLALHLLLPLFMLAVFGTIMGSKHSCPMLGQGLDLDGMKQDILEGTVSKVYDDYRYVTENIAFFFIIIYSFSINVVALGASFYPLTLGMFKKETANGLYSIGSSLIAQIIAEIPFEFFFPVISGILAYKLTGQVGSYLDWRMWITCSAMFICNYFAHSTGLIVGIIFNEHLSVAIMIGQLLQMPFVCTCGFIIRYTRLPSYMQYVADWSIYKHFTNAIIAARYGYGLCDCDDILLAESKDTFLPENVKHTMDYLFENDTRQLGDGVQISDLFDKLNNQFMQAQTYGMKLESCDDVQPYIMDTFTVVDGDLYTLFVFGTSGIVILKFIIYFLLRHKRM